jgi:hypothetical protein
MVNVANCARSTATAKKTNWERSVWWSNALILWTTRYMDAALQELRSEGFEVKLEDVARLSPLTSKHFHMLGRYHFHASEAVLRGELRPLRDPEKMDDELVIA